MWCSTAHACSCARARRPGGVRGAGQVRLVHPGGDHAGVGRHAAHARRARLPAHGPAVRRPHSSDLSQQKFQGVFYSAVTLPTRVVLGYQRMAQRCGALTPQTFPSRSSRGCFIRPSRCPRASCSATSAWPTGAAPSLLRPFPAEVPGGVLFGRHAAHARRARLPAHGPPVRRPHSSDLSQQKFQGVFYSAVTLPTRVVLGYQRMVQRCSGLVPQTLSWYIVSGLDSGCMAVHF